MIKKLLFLKSSIPETLFSFLVVTLTFLKESNKKIAPSNELNSYYFSQFKEVRFESFLINFFENLPEFVIRANSDKCFSF